jgi:hypothetical protein
MRSADRIEQGLLSEVTEKTFIHAEFFSSLTDAVEKGQKHGGANFSLKGKTSSNRHLKPLSSATEVVGEFAI